MTEILSNIGNQIHSHLHLLVDLPLYGVRGFPAAFIFRWSPFLHLWHSPGLAGSDPDQGWVSAGVVLAEQVRVKAVTPGDSGCHSRASESFIWGFTPFEFTEHACAPGWRLIHSLFSATVKLLQVP